MAASGNMYATGDPDRPPVRCTEPSGYAHVGAEAAFAVLTALASGSPHRIDISMQEVVFVANMVGVASFPKTGHRGARRGANIGRTREIWPCKDGWVSFGLRGGKARVPSLTTLTCLIAEEDGIVTQHLLSVHGRGEVEMYILTLSTDARQWTSRRKSRERSTWC